MQKSGLLRSLRDLISRESSRATFRRGPGRRFGHSAAAISFSNPAHRHIESLEDRTLLSVTANLVGSTLTVTLNANNAEAWISFSSGLKVSATADGSDMKFNGTLANTVTTLVINNGSGYTGVKVNFTGSNTISGSNGTAAVALTSLTVTGVPTINLAQHINATTVSGTASTLNLAPVPGAATNGHLATAVSLTAPSGTVDIAAGTYTLTGTLTITKAIRLRGAARDQVIINTSGTRGTENRLIQLNAAGSTIESLTMAGWSAATTPSTAGSGYQLWLNNVSNTTVDNVRFINNDLRVSIYIGTSSTFTLKNSLFEGTLYRYGVRGAGSGMLIQNNTFNLGFYQGGALYFEYGAATSGTISGNTFNHTAGVNVLSTGTSSLFDPTLQGTIINYQPNRIEASGLIIDDNDFAFVNAGTLSSPTGSRPRPVAILNDPLVAATGPITITNNTFAGYGDQTGIIRPVVVTDSERGHALQFDGSQAFGQFTMPDSIGDEGTMSVWVKINSSATGRRNQIIEGPGSGILEMQYRDDSGGQFYGTANPANDTYAISAGPHATTATSWTNLQFTWQKTGSGGTMRVYVNGSEVSYLAGYGPSFTSAKWNTVVETLSKEFHLGRDAANTDRMFRGSMDDIFIFNTALNTTDLASVRTASVPISTTSFPSLIAGWNPAAGDISPDTTSLSGAGGTTTSLLLLSRFEVESSRPGVKVVSDTDVSRGMVLEFDGAQSHANFTLNESIGDEGTFSAWVRIDPTATGRRNQIFEGPADGALEVQYRNNSSGQFYGTANPANNVYAIAQGPHATVSTSWTSVQFTWKKNAPTDTPTGGVMRMYVNGVEVSYASGFGPNFTSSQWASVIETLGGQFFLGRDPGDASRMFHGRMDDVAIFNTALSAADLTAVRTSGSLTTTAFPSLAAYWSPTTSDTGATALNGAGGTSVPLRLKPLPETSPKFLTATTTFHPLIISGNTFTAGTGNLATSFYGSPQNDVFQSTPGNDQIIAGTQTTMDVVTYADNFADYRFRYVGSGPTQYLIVRHIQTEAEDVLTGVEKLVFADYDLYIVGAGSAYADYATGYAAVPAGEGLLLPPATYPALIIDRSMLLAASDSANTIINAGTDAAITVTSGTVTLYDFTIIGGAPGTPAISPYSSTIRVNLIIQDGNRASNVVESGVSNELITITNNAGAVQVQIGSGEVITLPADKPVTIEGGDGDDEIFFNWQAGSGISLPVTVTTGPGNDTIEIDMTGGNPIPQGVVIQGGDNDDLLDVTLAAGITFPAGISFDGADGFDTIAITGAQTTATYNFVNDEDGTVDLDGFGIITYEGLNPINNSGSATAVVFNLPTADADVAAVLEDHADTSTITFRSQPANADFETANVVAPSNSLSIFPGQATHTLAIEDLTKFNSAASLTAGSSSLSFATVNLNGSISLASLSVFGSTINSAASETITISSGNTFTATAGSGGGTLAGVIAGAGAFTKDGPGNLASSGINTYSGDTTISAGTLSLTASGSSNPISNSPTINIASGATLDVNALNSSTLRLSNTPTDGQTLLGSGTLTGNLEVASGTTLSPSTSSSILTVGALSFTGGTYSVQIAGDDAGTQYDQVQATSVSLGSGVATLHLSVSADVSLFSEYVIINNSGSANTTGFFSGLAEGSSLIINGETLYISYNGGDGNDVVLLGTPQISGTTGDDTINVTWNGTAFSAVVNGGTPANLGSAVNFRIRSYNGADIVNIDFGNQPIASFNIDYNGGLPTTAPGDALTVSATGGSTTTVTHTFTNSSAGQIQLAGNISGNIFYAGLEPVTDNINAQNRIFQLNNTAQTLQLNNNSAPSGNQLLIDSDQSESVLFLNPTVSLAIYGGAAADIFNIESLNSQLNAHVTIDGNGGNDSANLAVTAALILAASRNLTVTAENIAQTNALTVPGVTSLTAISTSNISLTNASNDFTTFAVNAANNVSVVDANGIVVNASAISGDLSISAGSAVTFAQNVTAGGNLTVTAADVAGTGDDITVNASVTVSADNVVFNAGDAISMGANSRVQATVAGGDVTFTADATSADSNGGMTLDGQIQATTGTVTLQLNTRGPATQTSNATTWIRASELLLLSSTNDTADFNLDSIGNRIATLAAATSGDVVVRDEDSGLIIGNIGGAGGTNGITTGTGLSAPNSGGLVTINVPNGIITVQQPISTTPPASVGTATINISGSVLIDNTITAEGGNVTLNGRLSTTSDITVNFDLTSGGDMTLRAPRDVLVNAVLNTTGTGNIAVTGNSDSLGDGGVSFSATGDVGGTSPAAASGGSLTVSGSDVFADASNTHGIILAAGGAAADFRSTGAMLFSGGSVLTARDLSTTNSNVTFNNAVVLSGAVNISTDTGAGDITFDNSLNGGFNLDLTAGTGNITFTGAVGTTTRLAAVMVNSATTVLSDSIARFTAASFTQVTGVTSTTFDGLLDLTDNFDLTSSGTLTLNRVGDNVVGGFMEVTNAGLFTTIVGSNLVVTGSIIQNGGGLSSLGGDVTSQTANISFDTDVTLTNHVEVTSGGGAGDDIAFDATIVGSADNAHDLVFVAGAAGTVFVNGPVGGAAGGGQRLRTLELVSSNGAVFGVAGDDALSVRTGTSVLITGSSQDADVTFHGAIITPTLSAPADPQRTDGITDPPGFVFNDEYNLYLFGDGTHVTTGTLQNTGILQFGDVPTDSLIFENGIFATGQSAIYLRGIPRTYGSPVVLGDSDTIVYVYSGTSIIDTTYGTGGSGSFPSGANITIGGYIEGVSGAGGENLTFIAGLAGDVTIGGNAGLTNRLGIFLVQSANDVTVNNVTAQRFDQTTGTGTTTTNGTIDTDAGLAVNTTNYAPNDVVTGSGTRSVTLGVNLLTTHIVINGLITTANGGVQLLATVGGVATATNVGVVTLNNNGIINSDLDVIMQGNDATTGIRINALGTWQFGAPGSGDLLTGTQRNFVTTSDAPIEFRSNMALVASPSQYADRFIVSTVGSAALPAPAGTITKAAPILFAGTVDANYSDLDVRSGHSNVNFRGAVDEVQRLFLRLNDTTVDPVADPTVVTTTTVTFAADLTVELLLPQPGHYNVDIIGTNTRLSENVVQYYLPANTIFLNTGRTTLGNATGDTVTALFGLDTTASSQTVMAGTITAGYAMNLSPILLAPANESTTLYTTSFFDVYVQADTFPASVSQTGDNTLVLGSTTSRTNFTFAGDVTVTTLSTTLNTTSMGARWNLAIGGALDITGTGLTTLNNRGDFVLGTSGGSNEHNLSGGLNASSNRGITLAGNLIAAGPVTLTGGNLSVLANAVSAITTSSGDITLPLITLADSVDLTIGGATAVGTITTGIIGGQTGGASSNVRFRTTSTVTVNGDIGSDIDTLQVINSGGATFNGLVAVKSDVTLTAGTGTTTFMTTVSSTTFNALAGAGAIVFETGAYLTGAATIATTGTVTFGNGPNMFSNPDSFNFLGGLTRSVGDSFIYGTLGATNAALSITGAVTVVGNSTINAGTGGSSAITLGAVQISTNTTFTVGVGDSGNVTLASAAPVTGATATSLRLGSSGTTTVSSTITGLSVLQVDRGDATFTGNVGISGTPIASVILSAVSGATIFTGDFYATSVTGSGGAGSISFLGSTTSVTNAAAFAIGGTLTLGNGGDSLTFTNGITATSATIDGTLTTVSSPISINSLTSTTAVLTTGSTSSSTVTLGSVSGTTTITGGAVSITGTASGAGTLTINTSGNVTFSRALNMTGGLVVSATAATVSIPGGSVGSVAVTATTINLTTAPLFVTGATSLSGSSAVTLQSGSGINNSSSGNAGTITISAGAGGFSQAANAGIFTRNNTASAVGLTVTGGGSASIGQLVAVQADNTTAATVTINVAGALSDINDGSSGPATNNVRAGTFTVTGNPVGSVTNPIEYYSSNQLTSANNFWVVSTAPSSASGFLRRFDFTRVSTAVMAGTTGVFASNVYSATTASSTSGTHFGFTSGQSIAIVQGTTTSLSSYNLYIDSLVQTTRVATFHIDTNAANTTHTIRVYFGSATYATNTIVTLPGDTAALATANVALRSVTTTTFTATSDSAGTVSFEFKRPTTVTTGYWGVYGVDIAANAGDLPTAFPQMLADVTFDESGLTEETQSAIDANGRRGQILDESAVLAVRDEAIAAWAATGLSPEQMQILLGSPVVIGDLSADGQLGLARADHIVLDDDAMGLGWFVGKAGEEVPAGTIDLLTVMTHEFGHRLGYDDLDTASNPGHIMAGSLQPGERRSVTTERPAALRQPAVAATEEIAVPAQSETGDLFAVGQSEDATVASRISAQELVQFVSRPTAAIESDRQTLKLTSPSWIQGPASVSESSADIGLSQLDDLFADVVGTLDALN